MFCMGLARRVPQQHMTAKNQSRAWENIRGRPPVIDNLPAAGVATLERKGYFEMRSDVQQNDNSEYVLYA